MKKNKIKIWLISLVLFILFFFVIRIFLDSFLEDNFFDTSPFTENSTVKSHNILDTCINVDDHKINLRWFRNENSVSSFFILHGNGENNNDWLKVQKYLYSKGYSSLVFDYSGFGRSSGTPSIKGLNDDFRKVYDFFLSKEDKNSKKIIFAHSLGASVYLDNNTVIKPDKLILHAAISSARDFLVEQFDVPVYCKYLVSDVWNNIENVKKDNSVNTLIIQCGRDKIVSKKMRRKFNDVSKENISITEIPWLSHNSIYENPCDSVWQPVFQFVQ